MMNLNKKQLGFVISTLLSAQTAYALPQGSQVVQGSASFATPNASTLNITNSNNAIINWQQFNIGAGQTTNFIQPNSSSSVLNRVIGNNPSQLLGNLNSNGQVYLINQHGILVGEGARINTNGFFASTLNITNENYLNGNLNFSEGGFGDIDNKGYIHAGENGNVVLVAPNIENGGVIEVENGNIILAAGKSITITSLDNSSVEFHVQAADNKITNLGSVIAKNGAVNLFAGSLTHSGSIRATGLVRDENGIIRLVALDKNEVSGSVDVSGEQGGKIEILGDDVAIKAGAIINASGTEGGGEILIGGDQQGLNPNIKNATSTTIETNATITASATENGDGGRVIVFASNDVHVHEQITAKGGAISGDGGFIETSGLQVLDITVAPDASTPNGVNGEWLIDPNNITIQQSGADTGVTQSTGGNGEQVHTSNADGAIITVETITAALDNGTSVTITTGAGGSELGDININSDLILGNSTLGNLTLNAHHNINVNANVDAGGIGQFDLTLNADISNNGAIVSFDNSIIDLGGGTLTLNGNSVAINNNVTFATGIVDLNAPLVINPAAVLTLGALNSISINNAVSMTNNGTVLVNTGCFQGNCNQATVNGVINNAGIIAYSDVAGSADGGDLFITGTLNLNQGSSFNSPDGNTQNLFTIAPAAIVNVNAADVVIDTDLILFLDDGVINDFHNLTLPNNFIVDGGTINFSEDIFGLYLDDANGNTPRIKLNGDSELTLNGSAAGNYFVYTGDIFWSSVNATNNLILNNVDFRILGDFTIGNGNASDVTIGGANGRFTLMGGSVLNQLSRHTMFINVPVIANGEIAISSGLNNLQNTLGTIDFSGGGPLTVENGGSLTGAGTIVGDITVNSGGRIAPGESGFSVNSAKDNTGSLNITGNVVFNTGSILQIEIDDNDIDFDELIVNGNVVINGGDAYFFWDTLSTGTPILSSTFDVIQASSITGSGFTLNNLPGFSGGALSNDISNLNLQFTAGARSGAPIRFWTGLGNDNNWSNAANWDAIVAASVPADNAIVVLEADNVDVDVATNQIGLTQIDADVSISSGASLNSNGDIYTLGELDFTAVDSTIAGVGTWYNFGEANFDNAGFDLTKNVINYASISMSDFTNSNNDFKVSSTAFVNNGSFLAYSHSAGTNIDFSASSLGLVNNGDALFLINGAQTQFLGGITNTGIVNVMSPQNIQNTIIFDSFITNDGVLNLSDTIVNLSNGATFSLGIGSSLNGQGELVVNNGASFLVQTATTLSANQNLTLNDGAIYLGDNLNITGTMDWNSGVVDGTTGLGITLTGTSGSVINMLSGFDDNILDNIDMTLAGTLNLASNGAPFAGNDNRFEVTSSLGGNNKLDILNTATLTGGGLIYIDTNSAINVADATTINPKLFVAGVANFAGSASVSVLGLESGFNGVVNLDVNLGVSAGDTLTVTDLFWQAGAIDGGSSADAKLITSGNSLLLNGSLSSVEWTNSGTLDWNGFSTDVLSLSNNASIINDGTINISNIASAIVTNNTNGSAKAVIGGSGNFINNGTINLINANLDLGSMNLVLGTSNSLLNGTGIITGNVINSNGSVTIGNPNILSNPGALTINGNYTQGANGSLTIRIVDPINGNFSFDTFAVNGLATLAGTLNIAYFSNQVVSITESFSPFTFASRSGIFDSIVDSNGNILAIDFSNGSFTIIGSSSQVEVDAPPITIPDILQSQEGFKKILKIIEGNELNETIAFIKASKNLSEEDKKKIKEKAYTLVCR